jgi:hypothetical protein
VQFSAKGEDRNPPYSLLPLRTLKRRTEGVAPYNYFWNPSTASRSPSL